MRRAHRLTAWIGFCIRISYPLTETLQGGNRMARMLVWTMVLALVPLSVNAKNINYEFSATLFPIGVNGTGPVPTTATAVGTFAYDDASTPDSSGFFDLTSLTFTPDAASTGDSLDCTDMAACIANDAGNFARFNPTTNFITFDLNVALQSYALWFNHEEIPGVSTQYSSNNAFGTWSMDSIIVVDDPVDTDGDGLSDAEELELGTDPFDADTDDDGALDGTELDIAGGTGCPDPLVPDSDNDGLLDGEEIGLGTDPCNPDTDNDGVIDSEDPTPLDPGVPESFIEESLRTSSSSVADLSLDNFEGPNDNARSGLRNALSNKLNAAANAVRSGDIQGAIDLLESTLKRLDGDPNPPDWMVDPERTLVANQIMLQIALLELLLP